MFEYSAMATELSSTDDTHKQQHSNVSKVEQRGILKRREKYDENRTFVRASALDLVISCSDKASAKQDEMTCTVLEFASLCILVS